VISSSACANIALVKYWGKREPSLNLPETGSLSLTLDALRTTTELELIDGPADEMLLDGVRQTGRALERVSSFLEVARAECTDPALRRARARVVSNNSFPSAAGLASSASGFAALAVAANAAYRLGRDRTALSALARRGSGSAARSIFGGYVRMNSGAQPDGSDAAAHPIEGIKLELSAAIVVGKAEEKAVSSTDGMEHTRKTSPFHEAWVRQVERDLVAAEEALASSAIMRLSEIVEANCLAMHADAMAARPGVIYFSPLTLWAIERVRELRSVGTPVMFTVDAGPHVVAFAPPAEIGWIGAALAAHPGVDRIILSHAGGPATIEEF
jgi:diphosphomevalonate decarboxylase